MKIKLTDNIHLDLVEFAVEKNKKITVCFDQSEAHCYSINDFYLSKTEITEAQWNVIRIDDLMGPFEIGRNPRILKPRTGKNSNKPLLGVNWFEAVIWCGKLTKKLREEGTILDNEVICLPTLTEWFYAFEKTERCNKFMAKDFTEWSQNGFPRSPTPTNSTPNPFDKERIKILNRLDSNLDDYPHSIPLVTTSGDWDHYYSYQTKHDFNFRLRYEDANQRNSIYPNFKFGFRVCKISNQI